MDIVSFTLQIIDVRINVGLERDQEVGKELFVVHGFPKGCQNQYFCVKLCVTSILKEYIINIFS